MVNQNSIFGGMLTNMGAAKKTNCDALGIPWEPRYMLIGDANGADPVPSATQTKLVNQVYRAQLNQLRVSPTDDNILIAELVLPPDVGGWWIRELALEDKDGVFCAVANAAPSYKPLLAQGSGRNQVVRMHIITSGTSNIQLKIDPSVVLATREYVDTAIVESLAKLDFKHSVLLATTANIVLSGIQVIDGVAVPADSRVLVKNQTLAKDNGIYVVPASGAWQRALDADSSPEVTPGLFVSVEKGTLNGDSVWQLVTDGPIALGVTSLTFEMAAGRTGVSVGGYRTVVVDKYGRVTAGTNPTTLAGYGITDASAPLLAAVKLLIKNNAASPTTKIDVAADEAILKNAAGEPKLYSLISVSGDITVAGPNGLDTGVKANSTWYAVWLIGTVAGAVNVLFSTSFTAPVMPVGFTYKLLVGATRVGAGGVLQMFWQADNKVSIPPQNLLQNGQAATSGVYAALTCAALVPPNARRVSGNFGSSSTSAGSGWISIATDAQGLGQQVFNAGQFSGTSFGFSSVGPFSVGLSTAQMLYWTQGNAGAASGRIDLTGFEF